MKLFVVDDNKIETYSLSNKKEDLFILKHYSNVNHDEHLVYIKGNNGNWVIEKNVNIIINCDGIEDYSTNLNINKRYQITFLDTDEKIDVYCFKKVGEYEDFSTANIEMISIGSASNNHIIINNSNVLANSTLIKKEENRYVLESSQNIYINGEKCTKKNLKYGDKIFIYGLRIIWLPNFIRINSLSDTRVNLTMCTIEKANNDAYEETTQKEKNLSLYKENEYFFHTPILKPVVEECIIEIDAPPNKNNGQELPFILTIGPSLAFGITSVITAVSSIIKISSGKSNVGDEMMSLMMSVAMLISTLLFPVIISVYEKKRNNKLEEKRIRVYSKYLSDKQNEIEKIKKEQFQALKQLFGSINECHNIILNKSTGFWSREIKESDFLRLRFGTGSLNSKIELRSPRINFSIDEDILVENLKKLENSELELKDAPITHSLIENNVFSVILNCSDYASYVNGILIQLMAYYSSNDLKIVFLVNDKRSSLWDKYKCLSHNKSVAQDKRFFASTIEEMKSVSSYLEGIYQERIVSLKNGSNDYAVNDIKNENPKYFYKAFENYYLIITDDIAETKNLGIVNKILKEQANYGFSILIFEDNINKLPSRCNEFMIINDKEAGFFNKEYSSKNQKKFIPEFASNIDIEPLIYKVSNIPVLSNDNVSQLPDVCEFLEMFKVGNIDQLNICSRWSLNNPTLSLSSPIGVHPNGNLFELNLHEKEHGPHGLIAGSTGSGKSEFIITYILSMCVNYHPNEVQFVLIDYKGGGLAGAFENREKKIKIPHLVGTITNLDTSEMNRTLVSIRSELKRRQRIFNETRDKLGESTIDIYKYQKYYRNGLVDEPIAHLFIISDEFAELKANQPDFMDELVSTARIGRSLGVHLILATQKPSGVVDDQIWSNAKFKICLKVQSESDSQEMLRRPEAASIKETGRFYLQVGSDELFEIGQSAWAGAKYIPSDAMLKKLDDNIDFIDNSGNIIKSINDVVKKENQKEYGEQLTNIVKYLYSLGIKEKVKASSLWLPSIPNEIYIGNIMQKYKFKSNPNKLIAVIGEYDDPANQKQGILTQDLIADGNTLIYGIPGSGKEELVTSLMYSMCMLHSPTDINFYVIDCGSEVLKIFNKMPQVGEYMTAYDNDKVNNLYNMIEREFNKRKQILSDFGGSFEQYNKSQKEKLALKYIIINNFEAYSENYAETEEALNKFLREGSKMGIIFLTTVLNPNGIPSRIAQYYTKVYGLKFKDDFDYRYVLNAPAELIPKKVFGRGLTTVGSSILEFQTASITTNDSRIEVIKQSAVKLASAYKVKAPAVPQIPSKVNTETLIAHIDDSTNVPLGIDLKEAGPITFDFKHNQITGITGNNIQLSSKFLDEFYNLITKLNDTNPISLDLFMTTTIPSGIVSTTSVEEFIDGIEGVMKKEEQPSEQRLIIITGISKIYQDESYKEYGERLTELLNNIESYPNTSFILIDNYRDYRKLSVEDWYRKKYDETTGIWIGEGVTNQIAFTINGLTSEDANAYTDSIGYVVNKGKYHAIKVIESDDV